MFSIQSNFLRNTKHFDRESSYFEGIEKPQIQIKLNLNCPSALLLPVDNTPFSESELVGEIFFSKTITYLNIVILDENDNAPIFTYPFVTGYNIGFPEAEIAKKLMPKYLMQVEAYDKDEGINAEIYFSISSDENFAIDENSGVIYPLKDCMKDEEFVDVLVTATDHNGAADGNSDSVLIIVNKIHADNIVVISLNDIALINVEDEIDKISNDSGIDVRVINYFAVSVGEGETESKQAVDSQIEIFAYAYSNNRNLMIAEEIFEALSGATDSIVAYTANVYKPSDCNLTGLIVAVSVLGSLLLLIVIGTPLVWFLWLRYKISGTSRRNSDVQRKKLDEELSNEFEGRSSPIATVVIENVSPGSTQSDAEILGIQIDGATEGE